MTAAAALAEDARRQAELARAFGRYQDLLAANGFIDFGDQVALALRLVRESAAARTAIAGRFRYILVDEFQDTNRAQAELVSLLAEPHRNVTVVGDDDQAIYAFRGAAVDNILDFEARYGRARTVVLRRNYRSLAPILDASYRLVRFNDPDRLEVRTGITQAAEGRAARPGRAAPVRLEAFATGSEEADWIAADIARRVAGGRSTARPRRPRARQRPRRSGPSGAERGGHPVAVLRLVGAVRPPGGPPADGVPARRRGPRVERRPLRARLVGGLRAGRRGPDRDREHRAPTAPLASGRRSTSSSGSRASCGSRRRRARRSHRLVVDLTRYTAMAHERPAGEVLYAFLRDSGMLARLARTETTAAEEGLGNVARFFDIIRAQSALLADDRAMFVAGHLQTLIEAGDDPATADLDPDADAVAVLTVHKAKGLEFPVVYLPGLVAGRFPGNGRGEPLALPAGLGRGERADRGRVAGRGAAPLLRGDDPGARRAHPVACRGLRRRAGPPGLAVRPGGARPAGAGDGARRRARSRRRPRSDSRRSRRSTPRSRPSAARSTSRSA